MSTTGSESDIRRRMQRAILVVRREGWKAAVVAGFVEAVAALLTVTLVLNVVVLPGVPASLPIPDAAVSVIADQTGRQMETTSVRLEAVAGIAAACLVFVASVAARLHRPFIEQFESVNPEVSEALRTARDAVENGADTQMARRLYEDVLARLRSTSSVGLLDRRRLGLTVLFIVAVAAANVAVVTSDVRVDLSGGGAAPPAGGDSPGYTGLEDPDDVLGEPTDVKAGSDDLNASIPTSGEGDGERSTSASGAYDHGGYASEGVESQQAGYADKERMADAELIREYNLKIRDTEDDEH